MNRDSCCPILCTMYYVLCTMRTVDVDCGGLFLGDCSERASAFEALNHVTHKLAVSVSTTRRTRAKILVAKSDSL